MREWQRIAQERKVAWVEFVERGTEERTKCGEAKSVVPPLPAHALMSSANLAKVLQETL